MASSTYLSIISFSSRVGDGDFGIFGCCVLKRADPTKSDPIVLPPDAAPDADGSGGGVVGRGAGAGFGFGLIFIVSFGGLALMTRDVRIGVSNGGTSLPA
jgi:hypothetical protein